MRGSKAKQLRTADRPHPGRLGGGNIRPHNLPKGERPKWETRQQEKARAKAFWAEWAEKLAEKKAAREAAKHGSED